MLEIDGEGRWLRSITTPGSRRVIGALIRVIGALIRVIGALIRVIRALIRVLDEMLLARVLFARVVVAIS